MKNKKKWNFWEYIARLILKNRIIFILSIIILTIYLASYWKNVQFTFTEANLLPIDHPENIKYSTFKKLFGEEGNIISIGIKDSVFFSNKNQKLWNDLHSKLSSFKEIESILSTNNLIELINCSFVFNQFANFRNEPSYYYNNVCLLFGVFDNGIPNMLTP